MTETRARQFGRVFGPLLIGITIGFGCGVGFALAEGWWL